MLEVLQQGSFKRAVQETAMCIVTGGPIRLWQLYNSMQKHGGAKFDVVRLMPAVV